jgi:hypothetical protein
MINDRGDKSIAGIRDHVCDATLSTIMGRCTPFGSKSAILYLPEWRVFNADQGMRRESDLIFVGERSSDYTGYKLIGVRKHLQGKFSGIDVPSESPGCVTTET